MRGIITVCFLSLIATLAPAHAAPESPMLAARVAAGTLPVLEERLPSEPRIINMAATGRKPGQFGGTLRMVMADQRDIRMMTIYGYARMVGFDVQGNIVPDILARVDVEDGRIFTLHIRHGHRWSDGQPFTAEDFRYWWEDVAQNKRLNAAGPPIAMLPDDKKPDFEVINSHAIRYTWPVPNPRFLPALAAAQPLVIAMPAHYMRRFHERYADKAALAAEIKQNKVRDWGALHERKSRSYRPENPELPTLDPWRIVTPPPAELFHFVRNPYFHRVDEEGRQLPYIDRVELAISASALVPAKVAAGDADLQGRYLRFDNYTFLKAAAKRQNYKVHLWEQGVGAQIAIKPNLNVKDATWRALFQDVRVRRALSMGINRQDINRVVFFGLGKAAANSVLPHSPLYNPAHENAYTQYDVVLANRLLDQAGLDKRDAEGTRLLPDGRPAFITIDTAGESSEETDVLELVGQDWAKLGIRLFVRSTQRDVFRRRIIAGQTMMSVWFGMDNGTPGPDMEPDALAPANANQYEWPLWGQYVDSRGHEGEKISMPSAQKLADLHKKWRYSDSREMRETIWKEMLAIHSEEVFTIGILNRTRQPIVVSNRLNNVPETGIWSFEPFAYFGAYGMDSFWFSPEGAK